MAEISPQPGATSAREPVPGPAVELGPRAWPVRLPIAVVLFALLAAALSLPLTAIGVSSAPTLALLPIPAIASAAVARLAFESIVSSSRRPYRWRLAAASVLASLLATVVASAAFAVAGIVAAPAGLVSSFGAATGVLLLGATVRRLELAVGARNHRLCFVGSAAQRERLTREIGRRGDLSLVAHLDVGGLPATSKALERQILDSAPTTLVLSEDAMRFEHVVAAAAAINLHGLRIRRLGSLYEMLFGRVPLSELAPSWFLFDIAEIHRAPIYRPIKRVIELTVAAGLLVVLSPVLAAIALGVRRGSPGPVFFRQERVGKNGQVFALSKFRTMRLSESPEAEWASASVSRITPLGRVLRRYRMDELPQLWHVLRGQLSLVGPRPEQPGIVERLESAITYYPARHTVRPGLTGWAQINHGYGGSLQGAAEKLEYDLYYIKHQSLALDVRIIAATVRTVLAGGGE